MSVQTQSIKLRQATADDRELYFTWVNDELVREQSFDSKPVLCGHHFRWFDAMLADPTVEMFVLEVDGEPVGQIRLARIDGKWHISYSVDGRYRGKGYGRLIVELGLAELGKCVAEVKVDNVASNSIFSSLGFGCSEVGGVVSWRR